MTQVGAKEESSDARIHDLSETGLMFETVAQLSVGEILLVELPFIGTTEARVVWQKENSYGCEFLTPVSQATVSAALLKSSVDLPGEGIESTLEEVPVGISPSLEDMTNWEVEFERTRGANGYRLIGFRQTTEGMFIALVTKTN